MENKKVYAVQIAPEMQESPLFLDLCFHKNIIVTGNRDYCSHTTEAWDLIMSQYDNMAWDWKNYHNCTLSELLKNYGFDRHDGKPWTTQQRGKWRKLMESIGDASNDEIIIHALELLTGQKWDVTCIHGYCQGDWQNVYYPADSWSREDIRHFESMYFNTGSEWMIHDEESEPDGPQDISGYCEYFTDDMDMDDIKTYLAKEYGISAENVILYVYEGCHSVADYKIA